MSTPTVLPIALGTGDLAGELIASGSEYDRCASGCEPIGRLVVGGRGPLPPCLAGEAKPGSHRDR
jgi:hypothetical protein